MVPAAVVDKTIADLLPLLEAGDILIDGGNSYYVDDIRRAKGARAQGNPLCGRRHQRRRLGTGARLLHDDRRREATSSSTSIRSSPRWRPGIGDIARTPDARRSRHRRTGLSALRPERRRPFRQDGAQRHRVRPHGRLRRRDGRAARRQRRQADRTQVDAETTPLRDPEHYQYDFNLPDIAEVWRRGSVIASWLLDLTARAARGSRSCRSSPAACPIPAKAAGRSRPRIDEAVPAPVLTHRALRALQLPRRGGFPGQAAVGDALSSSAGTSRKPAT